MASLRLQAALLGLVLALGLGLAPTVAASIPDTQGIADDLLSRLSEPSPELDVSVPVRVTGDGASLPETRVRGFRLFDPLSRPGYNGVSRGNATRSTFGLWGNRVGPVQKGLWTDPVTGAAYARARWYDARNGVFFTEDPMGDTDSSNLYAFVGWQPTMGIDPLGLACITEHGGRNQFCNPMDEMELSSETPWWEYAWAVTAETVGNSLTEGLFLNVFADAPHVIMDPDASGGERAAAGGKALGTLALNLGGVGVALKAGLGRLAATRPVQWMASKVSKSRLGKKVADVLLEDVGTLYRRVTRQTDEVFEEGGERVISSAARGKITPEGIAQIERHLGRPELRALNDPPNAAMIKRLKEGRTSPQDLNFYSHELTEAEFMARGIEARAAHMKTLEAQGIPYRPGYEAELYHPEVIRQYPAFFNPAAHPKP